MTASVSDTFHCFVFFTGNKSETIDISGYVQDRERIILWAGAHKGSPIEAAKIQREISTLARLLFERHKEDCELIIDRFSGFYSDSIAYFLAIDRNTGQYQGQVHPGHSRLSVMETETCLKEMPDKCFISMPDKPWMLVGSQQSLLQLAETIGPDTLSNLNNDSVQELHHRIQECICACNWSGLNPPEFITAIVLNES